MSVASFLIFDVIIKKKTSMSAATKMFTYFPLIFAFLERFEEKTNFFLEDLINRSSDVSA